MHLRNALLGVFVLYSLSFSASARPYLEWLSREENDWLAEHQTIRLGVDPSWEPFEYIDDKDQYQGMAADYVKLLEELLLIQMTPSKHMDWPSVIEQSKKKQLDALSCVVRTPPREEFLIFTEPYLNFPMVIMARDDANFISSIDDIKGQVIGVVKGYATDDLLTKNYPNLELRKYDVLDDLIEALSLGQVSVAVGNLASITHVIKNKGITNIKVAANTPFSFELSLGVRNDWPELKSILDKTLAQITVQQKNTIRDKWIAIRFDRGVDVTTVVLTATFAGIVLLLVLVSFYYRQRSLRSELKMYQHNEVIASISRSLDVEKGQAFYNTITKNLALVLNADIVFIGVYSDSNVEEISTISVFSSNDHQKDFRYDLKDTPCEYVIDRDSYFNSCRVAECFPKDQMLVDFGIEGYAGVRLDDSHSNPLGILVAVTFTPISDIEYYEKMLRIFAARTASELERTNNEEKMTWQAVHDELTGLYNRSGFDQYLNNLLENTSGSKHVLCFLDLDQFKLVNDTSGHVAGDELLSQLGDMLNKLIRQSDMLARIGGDEFAILMENCEISQATQKAELIRCAIEEFRFPWEGNIFSVGVSIGLVEINENIDSAVELLKYADIACYAAKEAGRNRIHVYDATDNVLASHSDQMHWANRLAEAIESNQFVLFAQPIKATSGAEGKINYELLLRLKDSNGELLAPGSFMSAAERYNLITRIDNWVINHAFSWIV